MTTNEVNGSAHCVLCDGLLTEQPRDEIHPPEPAKPGEEQMAHDVCLLRAQAADASARAMMLTQKLNVTNQFLCALVTKLGRETRIHQKDIDDAGALGFKVEVKEEPGGFFTIRMKNALILRPS